MAATDRAPVTIDGLTAFLRKEYYRLRGIYINRARDESKILFQFWKDSIADSYRDRKLQSAKPPLRKDFVTPTKQAVPTAQKMTDLDREYQKWSSLFELDVAHTIDRDLAAEQTEYRTQEILSASKNKQKAREDRIAADLQQCERMLKLYFLGAPKVTERPHSACSAQKPPSATQQASEPSQTQKDSFSFMMKLAKIMCETDQVSNEATEMQKTYEANKSLLPSNVNVRTLLATFCSDVEFIKRVELHRQHINKSKLKRQTLLSLYYVELNEQTRALNFIFKPNDDGAKMIERHFKEIKDKEDKVREEEEEKLKKTA